MSTGPERTGRPSGWAEASPTVNEHAPREHEPGLGELVAELSRDLSTLMRQEVELAKAELTATARQAGRGAGLLTAAGIAAHLVLVFLSVAGWWGLGEVLGRGWSALVVAGVWAVVAVVVALAGRREIARAKGIPQTVESVKRMPEVVKGHEERKL